MMGDTDSSILSEPGWAGGGKARQKAAVPLSGSTHSRRNFSVRALGTALLDQEQANAFQQLHRRIHALGKKDVSPRVFFVGLYFSREQDHRGFRRYILDPAHEAGAIQSRHEQIAEDQVNPALLEKFQRLPAARAGPHLVAARLQHEFADGESLLVIVYTQNRSLWSHNR